MINWKPSSIQTVTNNIIRVYFLFSSYCTQYNNTYHNKNMSIKKWHTTLKYLNLVHVSLKAYKTASCAEIAGNYLHHWINVTCEKVAKNGPDLKKLAQKKSNWRKCWRKKKNSSANPGTRLVFVMFSLLQSDPWIIRIRKDSWSVPSL